MRRLLAGFLLSAALHGQGPANVLVVVNDASPLSREIAEYYARRRAIPEKNVCRIRTSTDETISRPDYNKEIAGPIAKCLRANNLTETILYIVTTLGTPLHIARISGEGMAMDGAAVDSELTLLYADIRSLRPHAIAGSLPNPFY